MNYVKYIWAVLALLCCSGDVLYAQAPRISVISAHTNFIRCEDRQFFQDVFLTATGACKARIGIECYRYEDGDSVKMYRHLSDQKLEKGLSSLNLAFQESQGQYEILPAFASVIRSTGLTPPGSYKLFLTVWIDTVVFRQQFLHEQDSLLPVNSPLQKGIGAILSPSSHSLFPGKVNAPSSLTKATALMERSRFRLQRYFTKHGRYQPLKQICIQLLGTIDNLQQPCTFL